MRSEVLKSAPVSSPFRCGALQVQAVLRDDGLDARTLAGLVRHAPLLDAGTAAVPADSAWLG